MRQWIGMRIEILVPLTQIPDAENVTDFDLLRCQSPSIQSPQQLESSLGAAQTPANTPKTKLRWIEEWIDFYGDVETCAFISNSELL
jgi:hypothetical protein